MFKLLKNLFLQTDQSHLSEAIRKGALLVDVRSPAEFSAGSVKGAINVPLDKLKGELSKFKDNESIVVFCKSGVRSGQAVRDLKRNGYQNITNGISWRNVNRLVSQ